MRVFGIRPDCLPVYSAVGAYLFSGRGKTDPNGSVQNTLKNGRGRAYICMLPHAHTTLPPKKYGPAKILHAINFYI